MFQQGDQPQGQMAQKPAQPKPQGQGMMGQAQPRPQPQKQGWGQQRPQQGQMQRPAPRPAQPQQAQPAPQQNTYGAAPQQPAQPQQNTYGAAPPTQRPEPQRMDAVNYGERNSAETMKGGGGGSEMLRPPSDQPIYNMNTGQMEQPQAPVGVPDYAKGLFSGNQGQWGAPQAAQPMQPDPMVGNSYEAIDNPGLQGVSDMQKRLDAYGATDKQKGFDIRKSAY